MEVLILQISDIITASGLTGGGAGTGGDESYDTPVIPFNMDWN